MNEGMNFIYHSKFVLKSYLLQKNVTCSSGKLRIEFSSSNAKRTSLRLSDTTSFAFCLQIMRKSIKCSENNFFLPPPKSKGANFSLY